VIRDPASRSMKLSMTRKTEHRRSNLAGPRRSYHLTFKRLFAAPPALATSSLATAEGHGWFLRRYDRHRATQFLAFVEALPALAIQAFDAAELIKARAVLTRFDDRNLTLADAHGLVIMNDRRSTACWSTDRHMGLTGAALAVTP
jgi:predicted nucleic acid-binding protein